MPVMFTALFGSHMRYIDYVIISHGRFLGIIGKSMRSVGKEVYTPAMEASWI